MIKIVSHHGFALVELDEKSGQQALKATVDMRKGHVLHNFGAAITHSHPSYLTVQVEQGQHIMLNPAFLQYINHSCEPNVFFDTTNYLLLALEDIKAGTEICFFYPSTEWEMEQPFICNCKTRSCLNMIQGAKYLGEADAARHQFSDFIQRQLKKEPVNILR